jgi:hypothetical protein
MANASNNDILSLSFHVIITFDHMLFQLLDNGCSYATR